MDLSIFSLFRNATLVVQVVMGFLLLMSVCSWAVIIAKYFTLHFADQKVRDGIESFDGAKDLRHAVQSLGGDPTSPLYAVAQRGVVEFNVSREMSVPSDVVVDNVRRSLHHGVNMEIIRLNRALSVLATCANTAPFIGLFGTVWGIMNSFHAIGQMRSASLATVAPGISEALVATAMGLLVAIPATIAYNLFVGRLNGTENSLINFAGIFLNRVQREITAMPAATSRPGAVG